MMRLSASELNFNVLSSRRRGVQPLATKDTHKTPAAAAAIRTIVKAFFIILSVRSSVSDALAVVKQEGCRYWREPLIQPAIAWIRPGHRATVLPSRPWPPCPAGIWAG